MRALSLRQLGQLKLIEIDRPTIKENELLVRTGASVICTSDLNDIRENPFNIKSNCRLSWAMRLREPLLGPAGQ